jgi:hypothetical protein
MTSTNGVYWGATAALYVLALALLWPTLTHGIVGLDDASLLREFAEAPFSSVFARDHFGHLRPIKNLLFWSLGRDVDQLGVVRAILLLAALASGAVLQRLATSITGGRWWGLLAAAAWLLNPTTAATVAWLSAANYVLALLRADLRVADRRRAARLPAAKPARGDLRPRGSAPRHVESRAVPDRAAGATRRQPARRRGSCAGAAGAGVALGAALPVTLVVALHLMVGSARVAYRSAGAQAPRRRRHSGQ